MKAAGVGVVIAVATTALERGAVLFLREEEEEMHTATRMQMTIGRHMKNMTIIAKTDPTMAATEEEARGK